MYRVRTIILEGKGAFYNVDDLFPILGINKKNIFHLTI